MKDASLWNEIGNLYLKIGSTEDAVSAINQAIELDPESGWFPYNLGLAYYQMAEFTHALHSFQKSLRLMNAPKDQAVVWNKLGDTYRALKELEKAIQAYKKADDLEMWASSTAEANKSKQTDHTNLLEMIRMEKTVPAPNGISTEPGTSMPITEESPTEDDIPGKIPLLSEMDTQPCRPLYSKLTQEERIQAEPAVTPLINGDEPPAEDPSMPIKKTIIVIPDPNEKQEAPTEKGKPNHEPEKIDNGFALSAQNDHQDAEPENPAHISAGIENLEEILAKIHVYEGITQVNPTNDRAWDTLGKLYKSLGRFTDAIAAYQKAIQVAPEREVYYYYLGLLYAVEQDHENAVEAFLQVLEKNPDYVLAHGALAGVYHRMGQENKANHHIATALPKMSNESAYNRACFHAICGDADTALEFLQVALRNKDTTLEWLKSDPDLDPIRCDQRFQELVSGMEKQPQKHISENFFSCALEGAQNRLLPALNQSFAR